MKNFKFFLLIILCTSCETILDVDLPDMDDMMVVHSTFHQDSVWRLTLDQAKNILDTNEFKKITDAQVRIYNNENLITDLAYDPMRQEYRSAQNPPVSGNIYTLRISAPGMQDAEATGTLPEFPILNTVYIEFDKVQDPNGWGSRDLLHAIFKDDPLKADFYLIRLKYKQKFYTVNSQGDTTYTDEKLYPAYFNIHDKLIFDEDEEFSWGSDPSYVFSDELINGSEYDLGLAVFPNRESPNQKFKMYYRVELNKISEEYYRYRRALDKQAMSYGNPLAEPVVIKGNIQNGLGIFSGYATSTGEVRMKK